MIGKENFKLISHVPWIDLDYKLDEYHLGKQKDKQMLFYIDLLEQIYERSKKKRWKFPDLAKFLDTDTDNIRLREAIWQLVHDKKIKWNARDLTFDAVSTSD